MARRSYMSVARILAVGAVLSLVLFTSSAQQQGNSAQQGQRTGLQPSKGENVIDLHPAPEESKCRMKGMIGCISVPLVQIDTVVRGKDGNFVEGLGPQNFTLTEEGQPQKLNSLDHFVAEDTKIAGAPDEPIVVALKDEINSEKLRTIAINHRLIVLYFDLQTLTSEELERSVNAAKNFVKGQMTGADLVAVVSFGTQFLINSNFTNDREALEDSLSIPAMAEEWPYARSVKSEPGHFEAEEDKFDMINNTLEFDAVGALSNLLGEIPGRKSVIEFTGSAIRLQLAEPASMNAAMGAANTHTVSFYEVDVRDVAAIDSSDDSVRRTAAAKKVGAMEDPRKVRTELAEQTDGKLFQDVKDFAPIFQRGQQDSQDYYLLGYYSTDMRRDRLFRRVLVKLVKVRGAQVRFRSGTYAPGPIPAH